MSWAYCAPKSRIRTREEWMSGWGFTIAAALLIICLKIFWRRASPSLIHLRRSGNAVVWRFLGDLHVVHVALTHAGAGDAHELRARTHLGDALAARITHGGAQAAGELMQDGDQAALVGHAAFHTLGHELFQLRGGVLEISIGGTVAFAH